MSGDYDGCTAPLCNTTTTVKVTSSRGDTVTDSDGYAGTLLESIEYNGAGSGAEISDTVNGNSLSATATDSTLGLSANRIENLGNQTYTTVSGGGTRESKVTYTYDSDGRVTSEEDIPDTSDASEDTCTTTSYVNDTTDWVLSLQSEVTLASRPCTTGATQASQFVSDIKYSYDSHWNLTKTQKASSVAQSPIGNQAVPSYTTTQTATYDEYGRVLTSVDADNRTTTTAYTPATGAEPTAVQVTDPAGLVTTTTYDPARDLSLTVTDPAGGVTAKTYDALGRVTAEWTPGNPTSGPAVDTYAYAVSNTSPSVTTEQVEEPAGGYLTSQTLDDSFGQLRETQQETAGGGTDVTDTTYNSDGWKALTSAPYYTAGAPSGALVVAASSAVPSQTGYVYDGDGRVVKQIAYALGTETWETDTTYGGNYVTVVPPAGGVSETTFTDGRDLTTTIYQYHSGVPASPSDPASDYDKTSYTYTPAKQLATITDAAGDNWSYTYDLFGDQLTQADPDDGTITDTYDSADQILSSTDARGKTISYAYDLDGRKTAEYDTTGGALETTADQVASWTYDTMAKGKLTSSTAYENGNSYTEAVTGYNSFELPSGTETIIPSAAGPLAGTYTQQDGYSADGQPVSYADSAAGGLPARAGQYRL